MPDVTVKIDGVEVAAPKGMFILEAARRAGIAIPNYCAHPDLRPWGECRMCTVQVKTSRGTWMEIACSTPVQDGTEVFTNSKEVRDVRRFLLEGMFVHHPLECPICDKSGECDLQSMGYEYEVPAANPFRRPKDAWEYDYLSSAISIKRDRCVQCGRCVRVCDELIGAKALAFVKRSEAMYISTPWEGTLLGETDCTSCGLCVQVCPVGALLYTPVKDTYRAWELSRTPSVCSHCSVGCRFKLQVEKHSGYLRRIVADREDGVNDQRLCVKGRFGFDFVHHPERILTPLIRHDGRFEPATWDEALTLVAERLAQHRGDGFGAIASGRLTNETAYLLQKFARAVMGTNNVDGHARLDDAPAVYGLLDTLGVPGWTSNIWDLRDNAGCVLLIGANIADSQPVLWYLLQESMRRRNATLIVVDPRPIPPIEIADEWLRIKPGTDIALLNGLAYICLRDGLYDAPFVASLADNLTEWRATVAQYPPQRVSELTGVPVEQLERAARLFATGGAGPDGKGADGKYPASAIVGGSGLMGWTHGTDAVRAATNLAILTGNLGRPGAGVNIVRGEANAQGSGDVGLLADFLPGYRPVADASARAALAASWFAGLSPVMVPGQPDATVAETASELDATGEPVPPAGASGAVSEDAATAPAPAGAARPSLPDRPGLTYLEMIEAAHRGELRALWVLGEDVARAAPGGAGAAEALAKLDFLVVSELFMTETARLADVILPSASWAEQTGTYTSMERRVQALQAGLPPVGESRADWQTIAALGTRLGYDMRYLHPSDVLEEIARVTPSYAGIVPGHLNTPEVHMTTKPGLLYGARVPLVLERAGLQWPVASVGAASTQRLFADLSSTAGSGGGSVSPTAAAVPAETTTPAGRVGPGTGGNGASGAASQPPPGRGDGAAASPANAPSPIGQAPGGNGSGDGRRAGQPGGANGATVGDGRSGTAGGNGSGGNGQAGPRFRFRAVEQPALAADVTPGQARPFTLVVGGSLYQSGLGTETTRCETPASLDYGACVNLSPEAAARLGIEEGDRVAVESAHGRVAAPAHLVGSLPVETVWMGPHYAEAPVQALFGAALDPVAKTPAMKACAVWLEKAAG